MTEHCLRVSNLSKSYGPVAALRHVNFTIAPAERVALIGHNGAGKTTLIKLLLGLTKPSAGALDIFGVPPGSPIARQHYAYLPENMVFAKNLTAREQLMHLLRLKGEPTGQCAKLLERVGIADAADRRIGTYSKGMRQRLGLAQLLIGRPRIVILDEPTSGLDPVSRHLCYEIIAELADNGAAVLLSSHVLTELEAQTDRIIVLKQGELTADGTLRDLRRQAELKTKINIKTRPGKVADVVSKVGGHRLNGSSVVIDITDEAKFSQICALSEFQELIEDIDVQPPGLEELYHHFSRSGSTLENDQ